MSPKITEIHVERGRTTQVGEKEWNKTTYRLVADVSDVASEDEIERLRQKLAFKIDDWLAQERGVSGPVDIEDIPRIDIAELNACGWQTYKKEPAKPSQAAWVKNPVEFTSWKDSPKVLTQLVKALRRTKEQKLILGDMEYSFSGKDDMKDHFISRKPVKVK